MKSILATLIAAASLASTASAATIAYQSFGGTSGGLDGTDPNQGAAFGFTGNWASTTVGDMAYVTNSLNIVNDTTGVENRAQKAQTGGTSSNKVNVQTNLASNISTTTGNLYVSFKFNANWTAGTDQVGLHLLTGATADTENTGTAAFTLGTNGANSAFRLAGTTQATQATTTDGFTYANATTYLFIGRIEMTTGADTMRFNIYRDLDNVPTLLPVSFTMNYTASVATDADINGIRLYTNNGANEDVTFAMDEIRLGTSWADVNPVPEPSSALLMLLCAGAYAIRRRRSAF